MSKFKSVGGGSAYRSSTGKLRVLSRENDYLFRVEVWLLNRQTSNVEHATTDTLVRLTLTSHAER